MKGEVKYEATNHTLVFWCVACTSVARSSVGTGFGPMACVGLTAPHRPKAAGMRPAACGPHEKEEV
jgi:hypothetical protein